jgi:hypothetical protein
VMSPAMTLLSNRVTPVGVRSRLLVALICCGLTAAAQNSTQQKASKPFRIRVTHLVGFEDAKNNCSGALSIQNDSLQFQQTGKSEAHIKIGSVRDIFLGEESRQVGGLPLTLGEAAAPFGSGRVVSLFAHKKYDTLSFEYVDADGGIHGAIFQVKTGQAETVRNELIAQGAAEVRHEHK